MRLPITPQISTKDGTSNRNARLTNCLKESKKGGDKAVVRPGLVTSDTYTGLGSGLIPFDGRLLVIYDDTVYDTEEDLTLPWPLDSDPWDAGTTYGIGDTVWYGSTLWFSGQSVNIGNTPGTSGWATSSSTDTYEEGVTYAIGDTVVYNGVTYYSMAPSNTGNDPSSTPVWSTTAPGVSRYRGQMPSYAAYGAGNPGPVCASMDAAAFMAFSTMTSVISCATKLGGTYNWITFVGSQDRGGFGKFIRVNQWTDASPYDCSGSPSNNGIIDGGTITQTV